ncbi:MAG: phosphoribosylformimino-5-aminoimidazole carboxamide ribotide isomerase [Eubacterium sp.]|nr:phosphoribosylformimino-5-aminoimidazole carboxamide ribotide isomerase [Eubacterium sp.]
MEFRPCIDIHNGKVKQIVGGSLNDARDRAAENFVSEQDSTFYADLYRSKGIRGGHVILLNPASSEYYEATCRQAEQALKAWPGGLQIGGGINDENADRFLDMGASHVIVTSFVFRDGRFSEENLEKMIRAVGREKLVLDLSCRRKGDRYYIVTDRWQKFTEVEITDETLRQLASTCAEFLIHAADVEGKARGVEKPLVELLAGVPEDVPGFPITYAGGVGSFEDLRWLKTAGKNRLNVTIGSALDLFGGSMDFDEILRVCAF